MTTKRIIWIDALNIVACAGVLLLHCTNKQVHNFSGTPSIDWYIGLFTHGFFLWPVNVFFMISGFTLLRKSLIENLPDTISIFYKRRVSRLAIPLLTWNIIYMLLSLTKTYIKGEEMEPLGSLIQKFCLFEYNGFMWFFMPLLLIYISMPFFARFVMYSNRSLLRLFLIIGGIMGLFPSIQTDFTVKNDFADIYLMGSRFLYFIVAGYYFGHYEISPKTRNRLYIATLLSMTLISVGTYILTLYWPNHYRYFISYINLPCTISAIGVFVFFRECNWNKLLKKYRIRPERLASLSSLSLGIYLIQMIWFTIIDYFKICEGEPLIKFLVMYVLCVFSVYIMKRLPLVKRLI